MFLEGRVFKAEKRQTNEPCTFRSRVRSLANLAVERGNRGCVHNYAALAVVVQGQFRHTVRREPYDIKSADGVDVHNFGKAFCGSVCKNESVLP